MSDFSLFSKAVHARFIELSKGELFVTIPGDDLWTAYLAAFPEGTNPIFRERTEHDCSCCRNFIRNLGNVVAIVDGVPQSVWDDYHSLPEPYATVAKQLIVLVSDHPITSLYRSELKSYGAEATFEPVEGGDPRKWHHFYGSVDSRHQGGKNMASVVGEYSTSVEMFKRALAELKLTALDTVLGLIADNNLYRGAEFQKSVSAFRDLLLPFPSLEDHEQNLYLWTNASNPVVRIRNTAIGTLLIDLSEDVPLEQAVASFENKVSGTNYKRPKALITKAMIDSAMATIDELGLEPSLQRRHAALSDITVNNVIWADSSAAVGMKGGMAGLLMEEVKTPAVDAGDAVSISIHDFMADVVPQAKGMAVQVKNGQQSNLMSVTAPVHADAQLLFKWDNGFAWSYNGNVTDSIKEKVKAAGGNTDAKLRVSLGWFNSDDLDIHAVCPNGHIYFANPHGLLGRILDVDMNAGGRRNDVDPVENLSWTHPKDGEYRVYINQFSRRGTARPGFVIEVENNGSVSQYSYDKAVTGNVDAVTFTVKNGVITDLVVGNGLTGKGITQSVWGVQTEQFTKVETLMFSPNFWDEQQVGNKHWFFILEGCKNPEPTRGIYNEYLTAELDKHRKVFEVLGNKTMCPPVMDQLSGVGFSSTRGDTVVVKVTAEKSTRLYNVQF